jgi:hypothetical protein
MGTGGAAGPEPDELCRDITAFAHAESRAGPTVRLMTDGALSKACGRNQADVSRASHEFQLARAQHARLSQHCGDAFRAQHVILANGDE